MRRTIILRGPCKARIKGSCEINAYPVNDAEVIVPVGRSILALAGDECKIEAAGCHRQEAGEELYKVLKGAAERLAGADRIVLIGPTDTGKTTLATFLHSLLAIRYGEATLLSMDVGQNELYAPSFASSIRAPGPIVPGSPGIDADRCFVGSFTPQRAIGPYLGCAAKLSRADPLVADTDGWVTPWEGLSSKAMLALAVRAKLVALIGMEEREAKYLERRTGIRVIVIPPLVRGHHKTLEERRIHRERLIAKILAGARQYSVDPDRTPVYEAPLFGGEPIPKDKLEAIAEALGLRSTIYGEKSRDMLTLVAAVRGRAGHRMVKILRPGWERGMVAASWCKGREHLSLITGAEYRRRKIRVMAPCQPSSVVFGVDKVDITHFIKI